MGITNLAPVVLFVYNRPRHTQQTIKALQSNELSEQSDLIIYSDAPQDNQAQVQVKEVRDYIKTIDGFKSVKIIERDKNWGLAANIIDGVTEVVNQYGKIIVMEDDLIASPVFLKYMNSSLMRYQNNVNVWEIGAYVYPCISAEENHGECFFTNLTTSWGWATWSDRWKYFIRDPASIVQKIPKSEVYKFNLDGADDIWSQVEGNLNGKLFTWAVFWYAIVYLNRGLVLYPPATLIKNIGHDGTGQNCGINEDLISDLYSEEFYSFPDKEIINESNLNKIKFFLRKRRSLLNRLIKKLKAF